MLQVSNLSKAYDDDVILENVSFVVNPGERVGLVGLGVFLQRLSSPTHHYNATNGSTCR